jgi:hypothetical protein
MPDELREIQRQTRALYDHKSPDYAERTRNYDLFPGLNDEIDRFLTLSLPDLPLVDLGCGPGRDCLYLPVPQPWAKTDTVTGAGQLRRVV